MKNREEVIQSHRMESSTVGFVRWIDNSNGVLDEESQLEDRNEGPFQFLTTKYPFSRRKQKQSTEGNDEGDSPMSAIRWQCLSERGIELDVIENGRCDNRSQISRERTHGKLPVEAGVCA